MTASTSCTAPTSPATRCSSTNPCRAGITPGPLVAANVPLYKIPSRGTPTVDSRHPYIPRPRAWACTRACTLAGCGTRTSSVHALSSLPARPSAPRCVASAASHAQRTCRRPPPRVACAALQIRARCVLGAPPRSHLLFLLAAGCSAGAAVGLAPAETAAAAAAAAAALAAASSGPFSAFWVVKLTAP